MLTATGCRLWLGHVTHNGYGLLMVNGQHKRAHRLAFELARGPIPSGLTIDHLCRVRACINPDHMEPVTLKENIRRGGNTIKTHCKRGHVLDEKNIYLNRSKKYVSRSCKKCRYLRKKVYRLTKKGA